MLFRLDNRAYFLEHDYLKIAPSSTMGVVTYLTGHASDRSKRLAVTDTNTNSTNSEITELIHTLDLSDF